jgi:hypothetical protein
MVCENDGTLHVAYRGGMYAPYPFLGYAWRDGSAWHVEHFQTSYYPGPPSLAVGEGHVPHVAYGRMMGTQVLLHAWRPAAGWQFELVAELLAGEPDIALDDSGHVHAAYSESGDFSEVLVYGVKGASGWTSDSLDVDTDILGALAPSLALDAGGDPHISYVRTDDQTLWYAWKSGRGWSFEAVSQVGSGLSVSSLRVDQNGIAHIAWWDEGADAVMYACRAPSGWAIAPVSPDAGGVQDICLALDPYANPRIAYDDATTGVVRLARMGLSLWVSGYPASYELSWSPASGTTAFWIYGVANSPFFEPGVDPPYDHRIAVLGPGTSTWSATLGMGSEDNYTYRVLALDVNSQEIARSRPAGEFDFLTQLP